MTASICGPAIVYLFGALSMWDSDGNGQCGASRRSALLPGQETVCFTPAHIPLARTQSYSPPNCANRWQMELGHAPWREKKAVLVNHVFMSTTDLIVS